MIEIINEYERIIIKTDSSLDSAIDNESRISSTHYHTLDTKQYSLKECSKIVMLSFLLDEIGCKFSKFPRFEHWKDSSRYKISYVTAKQSVLEDIIENNFWIELDKKYFQ